MLSVWLTLRNVKQEGIDTGTFDKWTILTIIMKFYYKNHIYYQMKKSMVRKSS